MDQPPPGGAVREQVAPSACSFWRHAEQETFFAPREAHLGCAVGAVVLGIPLDDDAQARLGSTLATMTGSGYLHPGEAAALPTRSGCSGGVLYGPLAAHPVEPDLVVLWVSPRAAMLLGEAAGAVQWDHGGGLSFTGRPGCAALPLAEGSGAVAASLGCAGLRRFTGVEDEYLLAVLPGGQLDRYLATLRATVAANQVMDSVYAAAVPAAATPPI